MTGECDFIIAGESGLEVTAPLLTVVEAKQTIARRYYGQCIAQMIGAQVFNAAHKRPIEVIYGCISNGEEYAFLKLIGKTVYFDRRKYYLQNVGEIIGVFQTIIDEYVSAGVLR